MPYTSIAPDEYPLTLSKHLESDGYDKVSTNCTPEIDTPHCLFSPIHYEPGYAYPLIVWLHGPGDDETQLRKILPLVSMRNHVAISPRATNQEVKKSTKTLQDHQGLTEPATGCIGNDSIGTDELGVDETQAADPWIPDTYRWSQSREAIAQAADRISNCISIASDRYHIHSQRIFLAGFDCGGTMALRIALEYPQWFAGAISLGGPLPRGHNLLRQLNRARNLPLLIANSLESQKYMPAQACDDLRLLHTAGFSLDLRQYPCGDDLTTKMLSDMDQWIMNRVCS